MPRTRLPRTILVSALATAAVLAVGLRGGEPDAGPAPQAAAAAAAAAPASAPVVAPTRKRAAARFPTVGTVGVPRGWQPQRSVQGTVTVSKPGTVVENLRITDGDLVINAPDVTVKRVEILGGAINNFAGPTCSNGLTVKSTTIRRSPGQVTEGDEPAIGVGGYTARRVKILGLPEGFRVGGVEDDCGPVKIVDSLARVSSPDVCGDWHGDALQGYDGDALTIRNSVLAMRVKGDCYGTAPFFYPSGQGNTSVDIDGLVVAGGGYPFRLGESGTVRDLNVVKGSWVFGPIDVQCSALSTWDAEIVQLKRGQPVRVRNQACNSDGGS